MNSYVFPLFLYINFKGCLRQNECDFTMLKNVFKLQ